MTQFVILPHQLFDKKHLNYEYNYVLWEHPHYFTSYLYNKKRIIMHRASMKYYFDYLKKNNYKCKYIDYDTRPDIKNYYLFDPIDNIKLPGKYTIIESPNFLLNKALYGEYRGKTDKFFFNAFYMWSKKKINVIPNIKSMDIYNRSPLPGNMRIPDIPSNKSDDKYIKMGIKYVNKHFKKNYGDTDDFIFPVTHNTAKKFMKAFINNKLKYFGQYQDAISKDEEFLFHSLLSTSLNIGLLNPIDVISYVIKAKAPMNSTEAFVRQLFWREYQRYCYIYCDFSNKNYFGNNKKLTSKWYDGDLGIEPVDKSIKAAFKNGYLHHIERLMVVGNFMNLSGISPKEGFRWFMEFSCDSYEWVMHQNVLDMVFFVTGGKTMRRPYISSSNYILKMSDFEKGSWCDKWDLLYKTFIKKHKKKMHKFRYYYKL
jgi:deoxyribodipyrimidine photolyase-related protein